MMKENDPRNMYQGQAFVSPTASAPSALPENGQGKEMKMLEEPEEYEEPLVGRAKEAVKEVAKEAAKSSVADWVKLAIGFLASALWTWAYNTFLYRLFHNPVVLPLTSLSGLWGEVLHPTLLPELLLMGALLLLGDISLLAGRIFFKRGPRFQLVVNSFFFPIQLCTFEKNTPLPLRFWIFPIIEVVGTVFILTGAFHFLSTLGGFTIILGYIDWARIVALLASIVLSAGQLSIASSKKHRKHKS